MHDESHDIVRAVIGVLLFLSRSEKPMSPGHLRKRIRDVALAQMPADLGAGQAAGRRTKDGTAPLENCIVEACDGGHDLTPSR